MGQLDGKIAIVTGTSRGVGVGISRRLLEEGASVVGCSRRALPALPAAAGLDDDGKRSAQWVCDQTDIAQIDAFVRASSTASVESTSSSTTRAAPCPRRSSRTCRALIAKIQGAPAHDDDFTRTALYHAYAIQNNLISPLWFARARGAPDARAGRHRLDRQHLERRRPSGRLADAGLLRRGEVRPRPPHEVARAGVGPEDPRELPRARADRDRELRAARARRRRRERGVFRERPDPPRGLSPRRSATPWSSCARARPTRSTAPRSTPTAECCRARCTTWVSSRSARCSRRRASRTKRGLIRLANYLRPRRVSALRSASAFSFILAGARSPTSGGMPCAHTPPLGSPGCSGSPCSDSRPGARAATTVLDYDGVPKGGDFRTAPYNENGIITTVDQGHYELYDDATGEDGDQAFNLDERDSSVLVEGDAHRLSGEHVRRRESRRDQSRRHAWASTRSPRSAAAAAAFRRRPSPDRSTSASTRRSFHGITALVVDAELAAARFTFDDVTVNVLPEPGAAASLFAAGLALLALRRRRAR